MSNTSKQYGISIESIGLPVLIDKQELEVYARKYLNVNKMAITLNKDHAGQINFIVSYDRPFVNYDSNDVCNASKIFQKLSNDFENTFNIKFKTIDIYELMSIDEVQGNDIVSRAKRVFGGLAAYLLGSDEDIVNKKLCSYEFRYGIPILVYKESS